METRRGGQLRVSVHAVFVFSVVVVMNKCYIGHKFNRAVPQMNIFERGHVVNWKESGFWECCELIAYDWKLIFSKRFWKERKWVFADFLGELMTGWRSNFAISSMKTNIDFIWNPAWFLFKWTRPYIIRISDCRCVLFNMVVQKWQGFNDWVLLGNMFDLMG